MSARRVLLTGASGFVGEHVARALRARGMSVRALVHRAACGVSGIDSVSGDLERPETLAHAAEGVDAVVHCAALLDPVPNELLADRVNRQGTLALARAAADAGAKTFVFISSIAAIGMHEGAGLLRTDTSCRPTTAYGRSKLAAERELVALELGELRRVVLRPPTVYGPGERRNFLALTRAVDTGSFLIPGSGENRMSFCYVDNLSSAVGFCLESESVRGILHVADEPAVSLRTAVATIARELGRRLPEVPFPLPVAKAAALACELAFGVIGRPPPLSRARLRTLTADCALDTSQSRALGFIPETRFAAGVHQTVRDYAAAGLLRAR